ncbi:MAG TPA: LamG domain-containing protein [Spongiibacteraceae bacterium]|nr:LamG domain-containing protein [Spongiibacteraceae bacterium]
MKTISAVSRLLAALSFSIVLAACSGGSGSGTEANVSAGGGDTRVNYNGPAPQNEQVQRFKLNFWDALVEENRCGSCHSSGQAPLFVRRDDINQAYNVALGIVDTATPGNSLIVQKVAGGHNCWLSSATACGSIITNLIEAWLGSNQGGGATVIALTAPADPNRAVTDSKVFPDSPAGFASTVYPVVRAHCAECHSEAAATRQQPYFASADIDVAYQAVKTKIDLDTPDNSRLVIRLRAESHNCWSDCGSDAAVMEQAIRDFAGAIPTTAVDPDLVLSRAMRLLDGIVASRGNRYDSQAIALYEFKEGGGVTAFDTSGIEPAINLTLSGDVEWFGGWGIRINNGKAQGSTASSRKLYDQLRNTGEYSVEAWAAPANVTQENARIVSYSAGTMQRNFTLGQTQYNYDFLNRSTSTDANGMPTLSTADAAERLQATLQHVVVTFDPVNGRRIYVNGQFTGDIDAAGGGTLVDWNDTYALVLGNEVSSDRLWQGVLRLVAVHRRALTPEQIQANFEAGVGERYFLLFNVSHLVAMPDAFIVFEVSQFDSFSYLFQQPFFISLDGTASPGTIPLRGMRLGMNGREVTVGQAWTTLDTAITDASYDPGTGQVLSGVGSVIALEQGPALDEFFLSFEQIGGNTNVVLPPVVPTPPAPVDLPASADIGMRSFEEINASMAVLTGVDMSLPAFSAVRDTYESIKQQLPSVENFNAFLSSHQIAVTKLSLSYCDALTGDAALSAALFPGTNLGASLSLAQRGVVIDQLLARTLSNGLDSQPNTAAGTELSALFDRLCSGSGGSCLAAETRPAVSAACSAMLSSATLTIQ